MTEGECEMKSPALEVLYFPLSIIICRKVSSQAAGRGDAVGYGGWSGKGSCKWKAEVTDCRHHGDACLRQGQ